MSNAARDTRPMRYRLRVSGRVGASWLTWFDADRIEAVGPDTVLHLRVADQSELFGRLRRIHDLNLTLLSLRRLPAEESTS